jgi:uncharacterized surface protein with fasciclin (FAS1) repeats
MWKQKRQVLTVLGLALAGFSTAAAQADPAKGPMDANPVMVGGEAMFRNKTIVENAAKSADHTTLVAAVKAAGLVETLQGAGPFTVFAPTDAAFNRLPEGTVPTLLKPENQARLAGVLSYHVLAGRYDAHALTDAIRKGGGRATLRTVQGAPLTFTMNGERNIVVRDANGMVADIAIYDVAQSNGVIHVIDRVLLPS